MYNMPLYRPPSEANSLIIQATLGCSHNKCAFCNMYKSKKFSIKNTEILKREILEFRSMYEYVEKIFIADGDALIIPMVELREIIKFIKKTFKESNRITMYASPKSIKIKTLEELEELKALGLEMVYMGIESGNDNVLKEIDKGATREEIIEAGLKIKKSGIKLSATVIAGVAGIEKSRDHAIDTASLINIIKPNYLGVLSLMVQFGTKIDDLVKVGKFKLLDRVEILQEIRMLIENINTDEEITFRSNHASNYISLKGELPRERDRLLQDIEWCLKNSYLKDEENRRL